MPAPVNRKMRTQQFNSLAGQTTAQRNQTKAKSSNNIGLYGALIIAVLVFVVCGEQIFSLIGTLTGMNGKLIDDAKTLQ